MSTISKPTDFWAALEAAATATAGAADAVRVQRGAADEYRERVRSAQVSTLERELASGRHRPGISVRDHAPEGGPRRDAFRPPRRLRKGRRTPPRSRHLEAFTRSMQARGAVDAAPREITRAMWQAGELAMDASRWRDAVLALPPLVQVAVMRAYTTPTVELFELLDASDYVRPEPLRELTEEELAAPAWDVRTASHRAPLALLCVLMAASETTTRAGFGRVVSGYSLGALATTIPNAIPYRPRRGTGARPAPGDSAARYGYEAARARARSARGLPRGMLPTLEAWDAAFNLGLRDVHQPDGGSSALTAAERGSDGRWAFNQYWLGLETLWSRWSRRRKRRVCSPDVAEWLGLDYHDGDRDEWLAFAAWVDNQRAAALGEAAASDEAREILEGLAASYADAEAEAIRAHERGDARAAARAGSRARALRMFGDGLAPREARAARERELDQRGLLERSRTMAADLARMRWAVADE